MQFITDIDQINHILNIQGLIGLQQYDLFDGLAVRGRVVFKNRRKPGFDLSESDLLVIDIILPVAGNDQHDVFLDSYLFRRARMRQQHLQCHRRDHRGDDQEKQQQEKHDVVERSGIHLRNTRFAPLDFHRLTSYNR